ncbi:hypothetical protein KFL_000030210 [Klebsormidium nitens]|uniref:Chalcone isomerase domain-containing protein n=1 Tax=Klebsormidium nitens TaxID=105231 RepID=A0A1Y1HJM5_KLENI|nr:hypothetical protein KFL_000030210 [Klebsormidium nitens]|eukprot:GAQ77742.1 hypothetical protein KFL_000030210 [Klebsormidium nitens]
MPGPGASSFSHAWSNASRWLQRGVSTSASRHAGGDVSRRAANRRLAARGAVVVATATTAAVAYDHYRRSKGQPSVLEEFKAFLNDALRVGSGGEDEEKQGHLHAPLALASLSLASVSMASTTAGASDSLESAVEPRTGLRFPKKVKPEDAPKGKEWELAGLGLRSKNLFGLKSIKVYAFGLYAEPGAVKDALCAKYGTFSPEVLKSNKWFLEDLLASKNDMAVRLVIYYSKLKIGSVRKAFEESVGERLRKVSPDNSDTVLQKFTNLFSDDIPLQRGTIIDLRRTSAGNLNVTIDGRKIGTVQSHALGHALFDLYIGDPPFDKGAKEEMGMSLARMLK